MFSGGRVYYFYLYLSTDRYNFITERQQFFRDILAAHNYFREMHGSGLLELDQGVSYNIFYLFFV